MCRNIKTLHNFEPPASEDEIRAAALQYVRKVSGMQKPSAANAAVFERAVDEIAHLTHHLLDSLHFDRALMGTFAFSFEEGLTTTDPAEAYTKELVMERTREVVLLADSRKVGTRSFVHAGRLEAVDVLVTDSSIDDRTARALERRGIKVIRA